MQQHKIHFIVLSSFSATGGIEKFNRAFMKAMVQLQQPLCFTASFAGMYDHGVNAQYVPAKNFKGFGGSRILFVLQSLLQCFSTDVLIIGHMNLALIGVFYKLVKPKGKLTVICHGIEVFEPVSGFKKKLLQKADRILAVSHYTRQQLIAQQEVAAEKITVFPNTIDPFFQLPLIFKKPGYLQQRYHLTGDEKVIFTLTRLKSEEGYKGYDKLIAALQTYKQKGVVFKYILAGKADDAEEQRIQALIAQNGLEEEVIMTGFIPDEEVTDHYLLGDVFAMPSKGEGFGIVFLEAMACGLPVIAGNKDGSTEALQFGQLGTLIDPDSHEELFHALEHILASNEIPRAKELQQQVTQLFSFEQFQNRLQQILKTEMVYA